MTIRLTLYVLFSALVVGTVSGAAGASVVSPFTETFTAGHANWGGGGNWQAFEPLASSGSGGPKGAGFVSTTIDLAAFDPGGFPAITLFRGQDNFRSSGNAFVGNWLTSGIVQFSFWVRHDGPADLLFSVRFTPAGSNSPSMNYQFTDTLVSAGAWTQLTLDLAQSNPGWVVGGGPSTYNTVFSNLGKIQIGADLAPLSGSQGEVAFDLSMVSIAIPAPGTLALFAFLGVSRRRRRNH